MYTCYKREKFRTCRHTRSTKKVLKKCTDNKNGLFFAKIKELAPNKNLHTIMDVQVCPNMKKVTLEKIVDVLENDTNEVILNDDFMQKALSPLKQMLELAK